MAIIETAAASVMFVKEKGEIGNNFGQSFWLYPQVLYGNPLFFDVIKRI